MARSGWLVVLVLCALSARAFAEVANDAEASMGFDWRRQLIGEVGSEPWDRKTVPCQPGVIGSVAGCFDASIAAANNVDYPWGAPEIAYPTDGSPWGMHITGPYPDGVTYLLSWYSGDSMTGPAATLKAPDTSKVSAMVTLSSRAGVSKKGGKMCAGSCAVAADPISFKAQTITYMRVYKTASTSNYSYCSPLIHHAVVKGLKPKTQYFYTVSTAAKRSEEISFTTLPAPRTKAGAALPASTYPLRIGLLGDVGQSDNSTITRDHTAANKPHVIMYTADYTYSDVYGAASTEAHTGDGTNQRRWDSYARLWEPLYKSVPSTPCFGNHEIEGSAIAAVINYTTTSFSFPDNYPFQASSARQPVPGTTSAFGTINSNLYYSTVVGPVKLIVLNNYVPFHEGTPQHTWAKKQFASVDRKQTPWLFVAFHAPPYHTYYVHYKEQDCFMSVYEDMMYEAGVDVVLNGHVHAYERTHPVYKYQADTCGPVYITIGDGGNVEGPYRNFVDEINPKTNKTYCESLVTSGKTANDLYASNKAGWGPGYQRQAHAPGCNTLTFQAPTMPGQKVLLPLNTTENMASENPVGFCLSTQPEWSAHRDPSFGHAILELLSDSTAKLKWYRNIDGVAQVADQVLLERQTACASRR